MPLHIGLPTSRIRSDLDTLFAEIQMPLDYGPDGKCLTPTVLTGGDDFEFAVLRPTDTLRCLQKKQLDGAFIGRDMLEEISAESHVNVLLDTGLNKVRLCCAAPIASLSDVEKKFASREPLRIATKYPNVLRRWASEHNHDNLTIDEVDGSVEVYPKLGADCIVDTVDSGKTLAANRLQVLFQIRESTTCFAVRNGIKDETPIKDLVYSMESVLRSRTRVLLDINVPNSSYEKVQSILGNYALESVNVIKGTRDTVTMRIACERSKFRRAINQARAEGGSGEIVTPLLWLGSSK